MASKKLEIWLWGYTCAKKQLLLMLTLNLRYVRARDAAADDDGAPVAEAQIVGDGKPRSAKDPPVAAVAVVESNGALNFQQ